MEYTCNVSQRKSKSKDKIRNDKKRQNMGHLRPVPNVSRKEKIMRMSDIIEDFIKELLEEQDEAIEIQRNELAEHFNCVPSQINSKEDYIMHIINNVGKELTANEVDILISDFLSYDIINKKEARLLKVATSDNVLQLQKDLKDKVRARIFKNMLLNLE